MKRYYILVLFSIIFLNVIFRENKAYWNNKLKIMSFRLPPPPVDYKSKPLDLNGDGKPDAIFSITRDS
ncbi:MAG: hypothetical protein LBH19_14285, partial [Dysgonamonadaceae bacterium]|nr:hypothetical protein [Dysgonamonadaceae bacterium]